MSLFKLNFFLFSQDDLAPYVSTNNRLIVKYVSSVNNVGTGWRALFKAQES